MSAVCFSPISSIAAFDCSLKSLAAFVSLRKAMFSVRTSVSRSRSMSISLHISSYVHLGTNGSDAGTAVSATRSDRRKCAARSRAPFSKPMPPGSKRAERTYTYGARVKPPALPPVTLRPPLLRRRKKYLRIMKEQ